MWACSHTAFQCEKLSLYQFRAQAYSEAFHCCHWADLINSNVHIYKRCLRSDCVPAHTRSHKFVYFPCHFFTENSRAQLIRQMKFSRLSVDGATTSKRHPHFDTRWQNLNWIETDTTQIWFIFGLCDVAVVYPPARRCLGAHHPSIGYTELAVLVWCAMTTALNLQLSNSIQLASFHFHSTHYRIV